MIDKLLDQYIGDVSFSNVYSAEEPWSIYDEYPEIPPRVQPVENSLIGDLDNFSLSVPSEISLDAGGLEITSAVTVVTKRADRVAGGQTLYGDILGSLSGLDGYGQAGSERTHQVTLEKSTEADGLGKSVLEELSEEEKFEATKVKGEEELVQDTDKVFGAPDLAIYKKRFAYGEKLVLAELRARKKRLKQLIERILATKSKRERERTNIQLSLSPFYAWADEDEFDEELARWDGSYDDIDASSGIRRGI
ncbi:Hypothetical protein conserved in the Yarrowia clade [Yarrowia lipolytica]|nr:Hypothetical protein conserved in the Yarrowia clade [Yarrowia lipolytica]